MAFGDKNDAVDVVDNLDGDGEVGCGMVSERERWVAIVPICSIHVGSVGHFEAGARGHLRRHMIIRRQPTPQMSKTYPTQIVMVWLCVRYIL